MVGDLVAAEISVDYILECFASLRGSTPVHYKDNEAQLRQGLWTCAPVVGEGTRYPGGLWATVDEVKHWVLLLWIEVVGFVKQTIEICLLVSCFDHELLRRTPPQLPQRLNIAVRQRL